MPKMKKTTLQIKMYQQLLNINDNVYKFFALLGLVIMLFGIIYPNDKLMEIHELKSNAKLQENLLNQKIDIATSKIEKFKKLIINKSLPQSDRDSLRLIVDYDEIEIDKDFYELEYHSSICSFAESQLIYFNRFRSWLVFGGLGLFVLGSIFWVIHFRKNP